ncbi:MAG: DUF1559 domain-containing protein [Planctomycetes bacterium]|nr:DUF1559 domain-containing protein [Planctomycetota bacterium]
MFCASCGSALPESSASCPKCGAARAAAAPAPVRFYPGPPVPPARSSSPFPWILIAVLAFGGVVVGTGILAALLVPALASARAASRATDCRNHLKQIGVYCALYESRYKAYPPTLSHLWRPDMATDANLFRCPQKTGKRASSAARVEKFPSDVGYEYRCPPPSIETDPNYDSVVVAWDRDPHSDGKRAVLFFTGRVDLLDQAAFERALAGK